MMFESPLKIGLLPNVALTLFNITNPPQKVSLKLKAPKRHDKNETPKNKRKQIVSVKVNF